MIRYNEVFGRCWVSRENEEKNPMHMSVGSDHHHPMMLSNLNPSSYINLSLQQVRNPQSAKFFHVFILRILKTVGNRSETRSTFLVNPRFFLDPGFLDGSEANRVVLHELFPNNTTRHDTSHSGQDTFWNNVWKDYYLSIIFDFNSLTQPPNFLCQRSVQSRVWVYDTPIPRRKLN